MEDEQQAAQTNSVASMENEQQAAQMNSVASTDLICYLFDGKSIDIRPAPRHRAWMDETEGYAYRCLPLSMANSHGWFLHCPESFEAEWDGGKSKKNLTVFPVDGTEEKPAWVSSHFGFGIMTFTIPAIFRTPSGYNMWIAGPSNWIKDGIQALNGLVESDWIPNSFTMNWKFTRPNHRIRFEKGDPFAFIFPVQRGVMEKLQPSIIPISSNPPLQDTQEVVVKMRTFSAYLRDNYDYPRPFEGWYMRGEIPHKQGYFPDHQRTNDIPEFKPVDITPDLEQEATKPESES